MEKRNIISLLLMLFLCAGTSLISGQSYFEREGYTSLFNGKGAGQANLWCWPVGSGELWPVRTDESLPAGVRAGAVPSENADKPVGQWNAMDIILIGDRITIINNGITVIDNAFYPGMIEKGPIGLQHHGGINAKTGKLEGASSLIQFRNIKLKEL